LLIGIENKMRYLNRLRAHGLRPTWHDPVEASDQVLRSKFNRADIVLFFTNHNAHSALRVIDRDAAKLVYVNDDNLDRVSSQVKQTIDQLGLLSIQEKT
jgi:hypothetical protein